MKSMIFAIFGYAVIVALILWLFVPFFPTSFDQRFFF